MRLPKAEGDVYINMFGVYFYVTSSNNRMPKDLGKIQKSTEYLRNKEQCLLTPRRSLLPV